MSKNKDVVVNNNSQVLVQLAPRKVDVAIVGGGISGLTTARRLSQAGISVVVLEANDRVGGRTLSHEYGPGQKAELGGTWVGPTQDRITALAKELGLSIIPQYSEGKTVYSTNGKRSTFSDKGWTGAVPPDLLMLPDLLYLSTLINKMAAQIPPGQPWNAPHAKEWDSQSFETWLKRHTLNSRSVKLASALINTMIGGEARDISLLSGLYHISGAGNAQNPGTFERMIEVRNGAQDSRVAEGTQQFSIRMAAALGDAVITSSPVRDIKQTENGVHIKSERINVEAQYVVVAVPPPMAARINYEPKLPTARDQLTQRFTMGTLMKCGAVYDTPFWREKGLNGMVISDTGPAKIVFDVSPTNGGSGLLMAFLGGDDARQWGARSRKDLQVAVIEKFVSYFGPKARDFKEFHVQDWASEPYNRGGPISFSGTGTLTSYGPSLSEPVGRIYWGGTEIADFWHGFMDGAVRSGESVANSLLTQLKRTSV